MPTATQVAAAPSLGNISTRHTKDTSETTMKAPPFAYQRAGSLAAACALLDAHGDNARILSID